MTPVARTDRLYFELVGLFVLCISVWGYFVPGEISRSIPWLMPALDPRFIGAIYLSGMVLMGLALIALRLVDLRTAVPMAAIWTGMVLLLSLLYFSESDFSRPLVSFWCRGLS